MHTCGCGPIRIQGLPGDIHRIISGARRIRRLREELNRDDAIRFLIHTEDKQLQKLPWQEWDFFERYPKAEIALSATAFEQPKKLPTTLGKEKVKILAILGNSKGIDIEVDRKKLEALPDADVEFLVEPDRQQLNDRLWEQSWDILFFAGHSQTEDERGRIYLNRTDSFTLDELRYALKKAVEGGLQLAIFNSCDGLGLAQDLAKLKIPQIVVMREPVPNHISQEFLKYFLDAFSRGESFYLAVREARERLQGLEDAFPCASWLPIIFQNPAVVPPRWNELKGCINKHELDNKLDTIPKTTEELGSIRTKLVLAKSSLEIRSALYEVENFLTRYPNNIEARLLKDTIVGALQRERIFAEVHECLDLSSLRSKSLRRPTVVWRKVVLTLLRAAGLLYLLYIFIRWILKI